MTIFSGKGGGGGGFVAKSDSCDPMDYSLPGSPVPGILQARIQGKAWPRLGHVTTLGT